MNLNEITDFQVKIIMLIALWDMVWKGFALWRASRNYHQNWFIAIIVINSAGILPIIYLLTHKSDNTMAE